MVRWLGSVLLGKMYVCDFLKSIRKRLWSKKQSLWQSTRAHTSAKLPRFHLKICYITLFSSLISFLSFRFSSLQSSHQNRWMEAPVMGHIYYSLEPAHTILFFPPLPDPYSPTTHQDPLGLPAVLLICLEFSLDLSNVWTGISFNHALSCQHRQFPNR